MPKNTKKKIAKCQRHEFSLRPTAQHLLQPQYLQISFCENNQVKEKNTQQPPPKCLLCPRFNLDRNFATPSFALTTERTQKTQGERLQQQHEHRMVNYTQEKSSLNIPKPRSKNHFCSVCRTNYSDYLEHIGSQPHRRKIRASEFNKHILELAGRYAQLQVETRVERNVQRPKMEDNNSVEIISNPFKKGIFNTQGSHPAKIQAEYTNYCKPPAYPYNQMPVPPAYPYTPMVGNYNFNINMNLYLNDPNIPNFMNMNPLAQALPHYYQSQLALSRLNQQLMLANNLSGLYANTNRMIHNLAFEGPPRPKPTKTISYIIIDQ